MIKTRFAPSPTGNLHVGGVRTALFSCLFAKAHQGTFLLRVEDTDAERSKETYSHAIVEAMAWLGLTPDEGPVYQSDRLSRYQDVIQSLLEKKLAYRCVCSKDRLESLRQTQLANKQKPRYDGHCRNLDITSTQDPFVIRLKSPIEGEVVFDDLVYGPIKVSNTELDDLVLVRQDGIPTYNFAVVVDDADMAVTHVIRGDDHINNTPRQIHIYAALGLKAPAFAHVPMILGSDGKRLSKRHGAVNVLEFREQGFLPEALLNYLVRLGWSHQDQEIFDRNEMITLFNLNHISKSPACFDYDKLTWLNQHYLKTLPPEALLEPLKWQLAQAQIEVQPETDLIAIIQAFKERVKTLKELALKSRCYLEDALMFEPGVCEKVFHPGLSAPFSELINRLERLVDWEKETIHEVITAVCETCSVGLGKVAQPVRVAVTGGTQSPSIDETLVLLGKTKTLARLKHAMTLIG